jgi:hypothetical protein
MIHNSQASIAGASFVSLQLLETAVTLAVGVVHVVRCLSGQPQDANRGWFASQSSDT